MVKSRTYKLKSTHLSLETLLRVSSVGDGPNKAVAVDDGVRALDDITVALLLAVLVVGILVIAHIETELV